MSKPRDYVYLLAIVVANTPAQANSAETIRSKSANETYRDNYDKVFGKGRGSTASN